MDLIHEARITLIAFAASLAIGMGIPAATLAIGEGTDPGSAVTAPKLQGKALPALMLKDALVLEDREGYNSEYIFGMTKAVLNSTLHPALKPLTCIITVPLDIVGLPFAALLGAL